MKIVFQSFSKPVNLNRGEEDEVFSRVRNPLSLNLRYRPEVKRVVFQKRFNKILFVASIAAVVAIASQATAKVFVF